MTSLLLSSFICVSNSYVLCVYNVGGEMGRQWYEEPKGAKYLCKENTFNDFCDVATWLVEVRCITFQFQAILQYNFTHATLLVYV